MWKLIVLLALTYVVIGVVLIATLDAVFDSKTNESELIAAVLFWPIELVGVALIALYNITKEEVRKHAGRKED